MKVLALFLTWFLCCLQSCLAQTLIDTDFSAGSLADQGWTAQGDWDVFAYPGDTNNPGAVARFAANKPDGSLARTFATVRQPERLHLSFDYGWGWGDARQGADSVSCMLLDENRNGYYFLIHRTQAKWAVQWARVVQGQPAGHTWAPHEIDATQAAIRDAGGQSRLDITRGSDGAWTIASAAWNKGTGGSFRFIDTTTCSFSQLVLLGTKNFDEQTFDKVKLTVSAQPDNQAVSVSSFLNSIGVVTTFPDRGQPLPRTIEMVKYCGFRWVRGGIEGLTDEGPTTLQTYLDLHAATGTRFSWGLVSGGADLKRLIATAEPLAAAGALLAFEGNNEPNNWGVTYQGESGGGQAPTWLPVARLQRDLYRAVKSHPQLKDYPVWSISEAGGQLDNVGLQYLQIPAHAETGLPEGTQFADFVNVHNYIYHPNAPDLEDNKCWQAADPTSTCRIDGLFGNHGSTWARHFRGYTEAELQTLPRVTTETGTTVGGAITEGIQGLNLLNLYLAQFKRGWKHTAVYLLRDRTDEAGNQSFGFFRRDFSPRPAATYLRNLTTILADPQEQQQPGQLSFAYVEHPPTVHDLLLQRSDGAFQLIIWGERLTGSDEVTLRFGGTHKSVTIHDPTQGTTPVQVHRDVQAVTLSVSDHPLVLTIPGE